MRRNDPGRFFSWKWVQPGRSAVALLLSATQAGEVVQELLPQWVFPKIDFGVLDTQPLVKKKTKLLIQRADKEEQKETNTGDCKINAHLLFRARGPLARWRRFLSRVLSFAEPPPPVVQS